MTDYGRDLRFGVFVTPSPDLLDNSYAIAEIADEQLDFIGVQDHPYQKHFLEAWAFMATLLARTNRVRVVPDVANLPLHNPAVLAKTAASLDVISGGRVELALGRERSGMRSWLWAGRGVPPERPPKRCATRSK